MNSLRVAQVVGGLRVGGAEKQFVSLMNALSAERKLAVYVSQAAPEPNLERQLDPAVRQVRVPVRKRTFARDVLRLAAVLRDEQINVVHTHMFWANLCGVVAARLARIPVVFTSEHGENRWKNRVHRLLERYVISPLSVRRFCVSPRILERRRDLDGVPAAKLALLPNGTEIPREAKCWPDNPDEYLIGSVGRFVKQKDFGCLVDVIAALRHRGVPVRGVILGDGPEMPAIREHVDAEDLDEVISLPGMDTGVSRWYRQFDIYACSSVEEGLPVTIIEAMSYGLPVVSTDVGAIGQVVRNGIDGRIVPPGNPDAMVDALQAMIESPGQLAEIGRHAREHARAEFSIEAVAATLERAYLEALAERDHAAAVEKPSSRAG
jgi:glycosyltransferase involved in cell wall biosynthesis